MTFHDTWSAQGVEEYYKKFIDLQERLRTSEEERLQLEMKFNEMIQITQEEEQLYYKRLKSQYKQFVEENRKRQERNERILFMLERIESRASILEAKSKRLKLLRHQYHLYLDRVHRERQFVDKQQQQREIEIDKPSRTTQTATLGSLGEIIDQQLNDLPKRVSGRQILDEERRPRSYADLGSADQLLSRFKEPSTGGASIADEIMRSIYERNKRKQTNTIKQLPNETLRRNISPSRYYNDNEEETDDSNTESNYAPTDGVIYAREKEMSGQKLNGIIPNGNANVESISVHSKDFLDLSSEQININFSSDTTKEFEDETPRESIKENAKNVENNKNLNEIIQELPLTLQNTPNVQKPPQETAKIEIVSYETQQPQEESNLTLIDNNNEENQMNNEEINIDGYEIEENYDESPAQIYETNAVNAQKIVQDGRQETPEILQQEQEQEDDEIYAQNQEILANGTDGEAVYQGENYDHTQQQYEYDQNINENTAENDENYNVNLENQAPANEEYKEYEEVQQQEQQQEDYEEQQQQYDENGQPYEPNAIPIEYDENGQPIQYDANGQQIYYDENGQQMHYDQDTQQYQYTTQYDENGQPIQYDQNYDNNYQYDENGQVVNYQQEVQQEQQPEIQQEGEGQVLEQQQENVYYDENGQPIAYEAVDENTELIEQENAEHPQFQELQEEIQAEEQEKQEIETSGQANVFELLDTESECTQNPNPDASKGANESDFDFSSTSEANKNEKKA